jgi:hypothetical protein
MSTGGAPSLFREYKPTVPEALPLVRALYARSCVGCCLHIVLDDGNTETHCVDFCIDWAMREGHQECAALARMLRSMSRTQRERLYREKENWGPSEYG